MNETPKKLSHREECCFLCKKVLANEHDKIRVFGKSTIGIPTLILRATKVDLSLYVGCEKIAICRMSCYKRLTRYKNALRKVDEIEHEIALEFNMLVPVSVKRRRIYNFNFIIIYMCCKYVETVSCKTILIILNLISISCVTHVCQR